MPSENIHLIFLITKPEDQAKSLCAHIENLGGRCIAFPTIIIKTLSQEYITEAISNLSTIDKVIFTSANAVTPVMPYWSSLATPSVFAIGPGTANALTHFQIPAKIPLEFSSEGLLALPSLSEVNHERIVIFSGIGGRNLLETILKKRGADVQKIAVYERKCPALTTTFPPLETISLVISTSEESLRNLWVMVGHKGQQWLIKQRLLVISDKMQHLAQQLGFKYPPIKAENASDEAILRALAHLKNP